MIRAVATSIVLSAAMSLLAVPSLAKDPTISPPAVTPIPWPQISGLDPDVAAAISGLACGPERGGRRGCVIVYDETRHVRFATLEGRAFTLGPEMTVLDKETVDPVTGATIVNKEGDLEAVSRDGDVYWVFGSHSTRRKPKKGDGCAPPPDRRHLYRFEVDPKTELPAFTIPPRKAPKEVLRIDRLAAVLATLPDLRPFVDAPVCADDGGFNIEGGSVAGGRMVLGLRAPLAPGGTSAWVVELDAEALAAGRDPKPRLHALPLGAGFGVRDLAAVPGGHLILAGPSISDDGATRPPSTLWFWPGGDVAPVALATLAGVPAKAKPEGLLVLATEPTAWRVLVVSDGVEGGAPLEYRLAKP